MLLLLCVGGIFSNDYVGNIYTILKASRNGRLRLCVYKYIIGYIYAILLLIIMYTPYFVNVMIKYPVIEWDAPIQSVFLMKDVQPLISIRCFIIFIGSIKVVSCLVMSTIIMTVSQLVRKQSITICTVTVIFIVPLIAQLAGILFIQYISLNSTFIPYTIFMSNSYIYMIIVIILGILLGAIGINLHCNNSVSLKLKARK